MSEVLLQSVVRRLRSAAGDYEAADGQLLTRFLAERDQAAFELLVRRHGPMVLGVCRRVLGGLQDAEDAFQATFLVLVRKAKQIRETTLLGNWLYGVAYRTAMKARGMDMRRRRREANACQHSHPEERRRFWTEIQPVLDQELSALPEKYRAPIVLCDLEGQSRKEAAQKLGWPEGTVATRLAEGRSRLAKRLARQGITLTAAGLGMVIGENAVSAALPASLLSATTAAANALATTSSTAAIAPKVAMLMQQVLRETLLTKTKVALLLVVAGLTLAIAVAGSDALPSSNTQGDNIAEERRELEPAVAPKQPHEARAEAEIKPQRHAGLDLVNSPLDRLLVAWEDAMGKVESVSAQMQRITWQRHREPMKDVRHLRGQNGMSSRASLQLRRIKDADGSELRYTVQYLPGVAQVRPSPDAYLFERYVYDGVNPTVYISDPVEKRLRMETTAGADGGRLTDDHFLRLVFDADAAALKRRFAVSYNGESPEKPDSLHRLKLLPLASQDKTDVQHASIVFDAKTFLPKHVSFQQPDGKSVTWNFLKIAANVAIPLPELDPPTLPPGWTLVHPPATMK